MPAPARAAHVVEAVLALAGGADPAAPGAAVTVELCGHWEHEGPCRWPHHSEVGRPEGGAVGFRTLFVAPDVEAAGVAARIERALRAGGAWTVTSCGTRAPTDDERRQAERMAGGSAGAGR